MTASARSAIAFDLLVLAIFVGMAVMATDFSPLARTFPLAVSVAGVALATAQLATQLRKYGRPGSTVTDRGHTGDALMGATPTEPTVKRVVRFFGWIIGFLLFIRVAGFLIAAAVFVTAFLWIEGRMRWMHIAIVVIASVTFVALLGSQMGLVWPTGLGGL